MQQLIEQPTKQLYVLVACEESQAECSAFRALGHIAFSCDIQECRPKGNHEWHIHADVTPYLQGATQFTTQDGKTHNVPQWDLIICHPPCTYLCKVGSLWLYVNPDRWIYFQGRHFQINKQRYRQLLDGRKFFYQCLQAKARYVAVENPIPMALARLPQPSCYADPSWFGCKYTKKTLYWLKNLPPIMPELINPNTKQFVRSSPGKYRSRTFPELARAIAKQWSDYILHDLELENKGLLY